MTIYNRNLEKYYPSSPLVPPHTNSTISLSDQIGTFDSIFYGNSTLNSSNLPQTNSTGNGTVTEHINIVPYQMPFNINLVKRGENWEITKLPHDEFNATSGLPYWLPDNGTYTPWKITEDKNGFNIQNAMIGLELAKKTGNAKFYDYLLNQERVGEEKWLVQYKNGTTWIDTGIDATKPTFDVSSNQTGVYATVTKEKTGVGKSLSYICNTRGSPTKTYSQVYQL